MVHLETFVVFARFGYRSRRLAAIAAAVSVVYLACSAVAAVVVYRSMRSARAAAAAAAAEGGEAAGLVGRSVPAGGGDGDVAADAAARPWWRGRRAARVADIVWRPRVAK